MKDYNLESGKHYRYLRRDIDEADRDSKAPSGPREKSKENVETFKKLEKILQDLDFEDEQRETIWKTMAAILLLGEVEFSSQEDGNADLKDTAVVEKSNFPLFFMMKNELRLGIPNF